MFVCFVDDMGFFVIAPSVQFEKGEGVRDRWSKTYVPVALYNNFV
jgi:hypothetical protein